MCPQSLQVILVLIMWESTCFAHTMIYFVLNMVQALGLNSLSVSGHQFGMFGHICCFMSITVCSLSSNCMVGSNVAKYDYKN
jgi:uncharacterized membrane protein YagU involved in acid resistance